MKGEVPVAFACGRDRLVGIIHAPAAPCRTGVVVVVGGPQYRAGSHRQFLLLARALAAEGIAVMRFDHRGLGDSDGAFAGFENLDDDIRSAVDTFMERVPDLESVVLWGLCDAASAILFYGHQDPRVTGLVFLNPWVRTEAGYARTQLKHYYLERLTSAAFWKKTLGGKLRLGESLRSLASTIRQARAGGGGPADAAPANALADRMGDGLQRFSGPALLIISGNDLTAREFEDAAAASPRWTELLAADRLSQRRLPPADHTFSRREWRDQVADWTLDWVRELDAGAGRPG